MDEVTINRSDQPRASSTSSTVDGAQDFIRNFAIISHVDHGKSTLADRLLEITGTVEGRNMKAQLLDKMDLEREKGITIKLATVRMTYSKTTGRLGLDALLGSQEERVNRTNGTESERQTPADTAMRQKSSAVTHLISDRQNLSHTFQLNLIDTPGHVDFSYEVSRSLAACEGALLVVDASQGIQAQTLANVYLALAANLTIIPLINKIDLPAADVNRVSQEIISLLGCQKEEIIEISAKTGQGVEQVLEAVINRIKPPSGQQNQPARALIFDSYYDDYRGVIQYVRIVDGQINKGDPILMIGDQSQAIALEVGFLGPEMSPAQSLNCGEIGYIVTNLKSTKQAKVGDTVTGLSRPAGQALPGYKEVKPFVYAGFYPASNQDYQLLKESVERLALSDSALQYEPENSPVLGFGLRIGFLGLLHMDIIKERLEREFKLELVVTNPSTSYQLLLTNGQIDNINSAAEMPEISKIAEISEPWVSGEIVCPKEFVGPVLQLVSQKRGQQKNLSYVDAQLAVVSFEAPLANLLTDFYDQLKSITSGYGSFNYELADWRSDDLVKLDFYIAGDPVDALSLVVHRSEAQGLGRNTVQKLKDIIPRQNFQVSLQAAIGGKFIAREDISAYRKDVTTGLYGGDVSRKKKVLAKQAKGKKRLKRFGRVDIPAEAFAVLLKRD